MRLSIKCEAHSDVCWLCLNTEQIIPYHLYNNNRLQKFDTHYMDGINGDSTDKLNVTVSSKVQIMCMYIFVSFGRIQLFLVPSTSCQNH